MLGWWIDLCERAYIFTQHQSSTARSRYLPPLAPYQVAGTTPASPDVRPPAVPIKPTSAFSIIQRDLVDKAVNETIAACKPLHSAHLSAHHGAFGQVALLMLTWTVTSVLCDQTNKTAKSLKVVGPNGKLIAASAGPHYAMDQDMRIASIVR